MRALCIGDRGSLPVITRRVCVADTGAGLLLLSTSRFLVLFCFLLLLAFAVSMWPHSLVIVTHNLPLADIWLGFICEDLCVSAIGCLDVVSRGIVGGSVISMLCCMLVMWTC